MSLLMQLPSIPNGYFPVLFLLLAKAGFYFNSLFSSADYSIPSHRQFHATSSISPHMMLFSSTDSMK